MYFLPFFFPDKEQIWVLQCTPHDFQVQTQSKFTPPRNPQWRLNRQCRQTRSVSADSITRSWLFTWVAMAIHPSKSPLKNHFARSCPRLLSYARCTWNADVFLRQGSRAALALQERLANSRWLLLSLFASSAPSCRSCRVILLFFSGQLKPVSMSGLPFSSFWFINLKIKRAALLVRIVNVGAVDIVASQAAADANDLSESQKESVSVSLQEK